MNISTSHYLLWFLSFFAIIYTHLLLWRLVSKAFVFLCPNPGLAFFGTVALFTISYLTSGLVVHPAEQQSLVFYSHWLSPHRWITQALLESEYLGSNVIQTALGMAANNSELIVGCERKEVLAKKILDCNTSLDMPSTL
nr:ATP-binding cassette sub-family G member 8 [Haemonchus contortus]